VKSTSSKIKWLRISYWVGAVADIILGIVMFFPGLTQTLWGLTMPIQGTGLFFSKYFGAVAIMWGCLLLWADRRPLERRGVALLTWFVVAGIMVVEIYGVVQNITLPLNMGILLGSQMLLLALYGFSYINSREIK